MPQSPEKYALLIGNDRYADFPRLKVPAADVAGLRRVLEDPAIGGFDQVRILMNPDLRHVQEAIGELFAERARDDLLLLYFSGHGERDGGKGALYLALADSRRDRLRATAIPADFIKTEMDESPAARQVLILDWCYAGAFGEKGGAIDADCFGGVDKGPRAVPGTDDEAEGYGRVTLTSSTAAQTSWEGNRVIEGVERSLFTHFLIRGLETGEAAEGRARVSVAQLYRYRRVRCANRRDRPERRSMPSGGLDPRSGRRPALVGCADDRRRIFRERCASFLGTPYGRWPEL